MSQISNATKSTFPATHIIAAQLSLEVYNYQEDYIYKTITNQSGDRTYSFIAIKGTNDTGDWLTNFSFLVDQSDTHRGFRTYTEKIYELIQQFINPQELSEEIYEKIDEKLDRNRDYIITGHSLGGASAAILAIWLEESGFNVKECITFGSPRPGGLKLRKRYKKLQHNHYRYVHSDDVVPHTPPRLFGYCHICDPYNLADANGEYFGDLISDHDMNAYVDALNEDVE